MNILTQKDIERFWGKVDKENSQTFYNGTRCWEWTAYRNKKGYGAVKVKRKDPLSHRVSFELSFGEIPSGLQVLHRCDNPPCVNPNHLFLGTQKDNMVDMAKKGRHADFRGEKHPMCKLSNEKIEEIRSRYAWQGIGGESSGALAKEFGVSDVHVLAVVHRKLRK